MDRDQVIAVLRSHEQELRTKGVQRLRVFGSVARGDQTPESDVDVAVDMDPSTKWSLFTLGALQMDMSDWLHVEVHLSVFEWFRPSIRNRISREAVDAL